MRTFIGRSMFRVLVLDVGKREWGDEGMRGRGGGNWDEGGGW